MKTAYPHCFTPLNVNQTVLRNRILAAPCGGFIDKTVSGAAVITRGGRGNVPDGRSRWRKGPYAFRNLNAIKEERDKITMIHQRGAKAELQLVHSGQFAVVEEGDYAVGPMGYIREDGVEVKAMTKEMMEEVAAGFGQVAKDAKAVGYDMLMLHFAHGWIGTQFLSPHFNKRTDEYGGDIKNRGKFPSMIVDAVRQAVGKDFPINMRLSADEHLEDGITIEDLAEFVHSVEDRVDIVQLTVGLHGQANGLSSTTYIDHMYNRKNARFVKERVSIPVAVVGAIMTPDEAEDIIASGDADAVVLGRALIADPFWLEKAKSNRAEDIVPCLRCMNCSTKGLDAVGVRNIVFGCSVNPRYLHETTVPFEVSPAKDIKNVIVVGGGPAGMKAALVASQRGHHVTLLEKESVLGGQLVCADLDPAKKDLKAYLDYLRRQIAKSTVEVHLNTDANDWAEQIQEADSVLIAVGASPRIIPIENEVDLKTLTALEAYAHPEKIGDHPLIVGGGSIGLELAKKMVQEGKKVTVIEKAIECCGNLNDIAKRGLLAKVQNIPGLTIYTESEVEKVDQEGVHVNIKGNTAVISATELILAVGMASNTVEVNKIAMYNDDFNLIGDCLQVASVAEATRDAYYATWKL